MRVPLPLVRGVVLAGSRPMGPPVPIAVQRRWFALVSRLGRLPAGTRVEQVVLGNRPAERVTGPHPTAGAPAVLWLHGGAFITGSPRTHRVLAAHVAAATGGPVLVPDYRLAPEHPYPAAVDDAEAAWRELAAAGPAALAGDSAGGALAMLLVQRLRGRGEALPPAVALVSPVADLTLAQSQAYTGPDPVLRRSWVRTGVEAFAGDADPRTLSPLLHPLAGLPPVLVQLSSDERLRPEGERLIAALREAGVAVTAETLAGLWHDVHLQADLVPEAAEALRRLGSWVVARTPT